jgi:hypothetical protein
MNEMPHFTSHLKQTFTGLPNIDLKVKSWRGLYFSHLMELNIISFLSLLMIKTLLPQKHFLIRDDKS